MYNTGQPKSALPLPLYTPHACSESAASGWTEAWLVMFDDYNVYSPNGATMDRNVQNRPISNLALGD